MKEHPIIFSSESVRAILAGNKIQTRRVVKFPGKHVFKGLSGQVQEHFEMKTVYPMPKGGFVFWSGDPGKNFSDMAFENSKDGIRCPHGMVGDRLWVKETFNWSSDADLLPNENHKYCPERSIFSANNVVFKADGKRIHPEYGPALWKSSRYMPRWASRITLDIVSVRVERVQDISEDDTIAEGMERVRQIVRYGASGKVLTDIVQFRYRQLWDSLNAKKGFGWAWNPWVWVIEFKRVTQ